MEGIEPCQRRQLPTEMQQHILSFLSPNERALSGRFACRHAADGLSGPQHCTASLSQPLPPHAVPWAVEAGLQHVRQLPFCHKLQLMCTATASGSEVNLAVALALLQPSIFPELLEKRNGRFTYFVRAQNPDVAAMKAGHPQLLGWLLRHCPGLLSIQEALQMAAQLCDLAGLQAVWELFMSHHRSSISSSTKYWEVVFDRPILGTEVLDAAAASAAPDAVTKMAWLLANPASSISRLQESTAAAAARSGDLGRLRWLRERGCPMDGENRRVLLSALQHADLAVAQWLVDEAGCCALPAVESGVQGWDSLARAAFASSDGLLKLQWLQARGAPPLTAVQNGEPAVRDWACSAIESGQVQTVQYLLSAFGARQLFQGNAELCSRLAAKSGSIAMAECLCGAGLLLTRRAYTGAAQAGSVAMIRWLAHDAKVPTGASLLELLADVVGTWPCMTQAHSRGLLDAVQLLVGAGVNVLAEEEEEEEEAELNEGIEALSARRLFSKALQKGDLALVQYMQEQQHRVPLVPQHDDVESAAQAGCEALLEWLVGQLGCLDGTAENPYMSAAEVGDLGTLGTMRRLGVPWGSNDKLLTVIKWRCCEPALRWLVEQGLPMGGAEEVEEAVAHGEKRRALGAEEAAWLRGLAAGGAAGGAEG